MYNFFDVFDVPDISALHEESKISENPPMTETKPISEGD